MATVLNGLWQGMALTLAVALVLKVLPRINAATRYAVWWIVLAAVVILPLRGALVRPGAGQASAADSAVAPEPAREVVPTPNVAGLANHSTGVVAPATRAPVSDQLAAPVTWLPIRLARGPVLGTIAVLWAIASMALLARLVVSFRALRRLKRDAAPAPERLQMRLVALRGKARVWRGARLLVTDDVAAPMVLGLFDPVMLIPRNLLREITSEDFDLVALHELAHLGRYDDWTNLFQRIGEALFPIQPATFWIGRQLTLERETACDDRVIAVTGTAKPYAASLTRIAELTLWARSGILASAAAGHPSQLFRRIQRLLDQKRNIAPEVSPPPLLIATGVVIALGFAVMGAPQLLALTDPPSPPDWATILAARPARVAVRVAGAAPAVAAAAAPDAGAAEAAEPGTVTRSFNVRPGEKLVVDVDRGNIHVETWDQNAVNVVVTQRGDGLDEYLKHHHITMMQQNHEIDVRASTDAQGGTPGSNIQIEYKITVPMKFDANLKDAAGNIGVAGLSGAVVEESAAGNVGIEKCAGQLDAHTAAGNVGIERTEGNVTGHSDAGNVAARECRGGVKLDTAAGNAVLEKIDGPAEAHSGAGNVDADTCSDTLKVTSGQGNVSVRRFTGSSLTAHTGAGNVSAEIVGPLKEDSSVMSSMGNVYAKLDPACATNLSASTSVGRVDSDFPTNDHGTGPKLRVETGMGNVQITKN